MFSYKRIRIDSAEELETQIKIFDSWENGPNGFDKLMIITKSESVARLGADAGVCVIGILTSEASGFFDSAFACVTNPEECSESFFDQQMAHFLGEPYTVWSNETMVVRESIESDFDSLRAIAENEAGSLNWMDEATEAMTDRESFLAYIGTAYRFYGFGMWTLLIDGRVAGWIGFAPGEDDADGGTSIDAGYILGQEFRGHGITELVMRHLIVYAAEEIGIDKIYVRADPKNEVSACIAEKLGFAREAGRDSNGCISFVLHV